MSSSDDHMEREYSSQSLSSRGGSESGSHNEYESRLSMSSFAATVFIASLMILGILMVTMVVTLTMMLQSCRSQKSGIVEEKRSYYDDYYCKTVVLHMELNRLEEAELPSICKDYTVSYISEGQYLRVLNSTVSVAEKYFSSLRPPDRGFTAVLLDIDDILPSCFPYSKPVKNSNKDRTDEAIKSRRILMLRLYNRIKESGWPLILITKRTQEQRNVITKYLFSAGYMGWESLVMRSTNDVMLTNLDYFSRRITALERQGYHIAGVISTNMDTLAGENEGKRMFKLPNMKFHNVECSNFS